jgi:putative aminopeptidase FrvX
VALIGPGVDASHNYERTHTEALVATAKWVMAYLLEE